MQIHMQTGYKDRVIVFIVRIYGSLYLYLSQVGKYAGRANFWFLAQVERFHKNLGFK